MKPRMAFLAWLAIMLLFLAGCGAGASGSAATPDLLPTRTPRPTFTPTVPLPTATLLVPTLTPLPTPTPEVSATAALSTTAAAALPTATTQAQAILTANDLVNVRSGPSTDFPKIGQLTQGQQGVITGKNQGGDWWQFTFNGQTGWVSAAMVSVNDAASTVQVAQNIPEPPAPVEQPQPVVQQAAPAPQPTQAPAAPAPTAAPSYPFAAAGANAPWGPNPESNSLVSVRGRIGCNPNAQTCVAAILKVTGPGGSGQATCLSGLQPWYANNNPMPVFLYNTGHPDCKLEIKPFVAGVYSAVLVDSNGNPQSDTQTFDAEGNQRDWLVIFNVR